MEGMRGLCELCYAVVNGNWVRPFSRLSGLIHRAVECSLVYMDHRRKAPSTSTVTPNTIGLEKQVVRSIMTSRSISILCVALLFYL